MRRIATLITCHNRKEKTLSCLNKLFNNKLPDGYSLYVFLVDDGSTDGTGQAVHDYYPEVDIIKGDGNLFWNGGMRVAFNAAMAKNFDFYLWLNDDTLLYPTALQNLIKTSKQLTIKNGNGVIVVGSTQDEVTGKASYGGVSRPSKWKPTTFKLITPSSNPIECETMNGNCVLIPNEIVKKIGGIESKFTHAMGDLDYGLRARYGGFSVWIIANYVGLCSNNSILDSFNDASLPLSVRLRKMLQPKGLPQTSWRVFTQRHAGVLWPFYWLWPYVKVILKGLVGK